MTYRLGEVIGGIISLFLWTYAVSRLIRVLIPKNWNVGHSRAVAANVVSWTICTAFTSLSPISDELFGGESLGLRLGIFGLSFLMPQFLWIVTDIGRGARSPRAST